jgi:predicted dithiol-disulfide oxidoreductase (DUF899 family)
MTTHTTATRKDWLTARLELLKAEKEHTRAGDELTRRRQELPWVRVDKSYQFETETGKATLADLFQGRSQLLVYHFMFGPEYSAGCPSCSSLADSFDGAAVHLANHDVMFTLVSRAPLAQLLPFKRRMGWALPWASSAGSDFNTDFNIAFTEDQQRTGGIEYNYHCEPPMRDLPRNEPLAGKTAPAWVERSGEGPVAQIAAMTGTDVPTYTRDRPGLSAFVRDGGVVYHTYSTYARGLDGLWGMYQLLDRAPLGRNETGVWWRHHDKYAKS